MEAFRDRFVAVELLSYTEVEVDWVECDCMRQAEQFEHLVEGYRERFFTYVLLQSAFRELPLAHTLYIAAG